jgi:transposase-like protein
MPWRAKDVMEQRIEFVIRAVQGGEPLSRLCREHGISRPTGYLWVQRYREVGSVQGLGEHSRRPQHSPGRTPLGQEERVVGLRQRYAGGADIALHVGAPGPVKKPPRYPWRSNANRRIHTNQCMRHPSLPVKEREAGSRFQVSGVRRQQSEGLQYALGRRQPALWTIGLIRGPKD